MRTFQVSGILLICLYILQNQGCEAKSLRHSETHVLKRQQRDFPKADDLIGNYQSVALLKGYITKKQKKYPSIIKNRTAYSSEDTLEYKFYPSTAGLVQFKVRANNDIHVALSCSAAERDPIYEVFIGGWSNARSVVRNYSIETSTVTETPGILNGDEFRGFWVRWNNGTISAGNEGNSTPFLSYTDSEKLKIEYVGVRSGWGASGSWIIKQGEAGHWVAAVNNTVPPGAFQGGDENGVPMYIVRANFNGGSFPGKLVGNRTSFANKDESGEVADLTEYEVLCDFGGSWETWKSSGDAIPSNVVVGGQSEEGDPLYIGRVKHENSMIVGRVQAKDDGMLLYIIHERSVKSFTDYEILVS